MRGEGSPPTAVRAVVFGALCQLDAELLNQLLVRRDCCTMSAIKILQARTHSCLMHSKLLYYEGLCQVSQPCCQKHVHAWHLGLQA